MANTARLTRIELITTKNLEGGAVALIADRCGGIAACSQAIHDSPIIDFCS